MKIKHAGWALALAGTLALPAIAAEPAVVAAGGPVVTSGTGVVVTPGVAPATPRTVSVPGAAVAEIDTNTVVAGNTKTTITRYWTNVPPDAKRSAEFQRWQALK